MFTQPGVQADFGETQGRSLAISIYGSTSSENLFLIDGVNTTNVIKGFQGKDINTEFIQEVEVKTGGYQAEYGRNTGGVINVITKSGGNEFHGGVFGYYNDTGMRANQKQGEAENFATPDFSEEGDAQFLNSALTKDNRVEWGADLGGFVMKDRIWFFGAFDRVLVNQTQTQFDLTNPVTFGHDFPIDLTQNKYSGKLTFNILQGTSVVGSVFSDAQTQTGTINAFPTRPEPDCQRRAPRHGRPGLRGPGEPALRFLRNLDGPVRPAQGSLQHQAPGPGSSPSCATTPFSPTGARSSPTAASAASSARRSTTRRSVRASAGPSRPTSPTTSSRSAATTRRTTRSARRTSRAASACACVPACRRARATATWPQAPFYTNSDGDTFQVFYQHDLFVDGTPASFTVLDQAPFETPTKRYGGFFQDQWRIIPTLTVNLGIRYDSENDLQQQPGVGLRAQGPVGAALRRGVGFRGRRHLEAVRFGGPLLLCPPDGPERPRVQRQQSALHVQLQPDRSSTSPTGAPRNALFQGGSPTGEPVDEGMKAAYQDELTLGVEKALDPTLSVGIKGTYRTLGRTVEDRCDLDYIDPLSGGSTCALFNPGSDGLAASGGIGSCNGSGNPTDPTGSVPSAPGPLPGVPVGDAKRIFRGIELTARKQFTNTLWAQVSYLFSSLRGNYSGAIREASGQTDPGINADFDYYQFSFNGYGKLELDRPHQARIDTVYNAPFGLSAGLQFYVRSGVPISRFGFFNNFYPDLLYLDDRGSNGRTPTDYDMNVSLGYNVNMGPVTVTPQVYLYNVLNRQTPTSVDATFNPGGSFDDDPTSPTYGEAVLDNPDYRKVNLRNNPRLLRVALKITF